MDWIHYYGHECQRTNGIDLLGDSNFCIKLTNDKSVSLQTESGLESADVLWYRRWNRSRSLEAHIPVNEKMLHEDVISLVKSEFDGLTRALFFAMNKQKWDDTPEYIQDYPIKMKQLEVARSVGLLIPKTIVTNNKRDLQVFMQENHIENLIIKPIKNGTAISSTEGTYVTYTSKVSESLSEVPDTFFPSLFQEAVIKEYEIRTFFYMEECHSMAIFSARDEKTSVDFRNYNFEKPNRNVPYKLPDDVEAKIRNLMKSLNLISGSIDILVNKSGDHIFLEVNAVGQFSMVSFPCNYYLERKLARSLILKQEK
ncbi:grasp-with-spasm system ATP-grasp peptide maturase [Mucilaginibacter sp. CSA2-8R]|uniref:grasp-with-spasm system ATP-grasp peptide maturase n=1 Tax=Mucilaginibacter sp. CSA2-8R TaxID=3141542 RepID=UPI00315D1875